jgi:hypothetical protein
MKRVVGSVAVRHPDSECVAHAARIRWSGKGHARLVIRGRTAGWAASQPVRRRYSGGTRSTSQIRSAPE